MAYENLKLVCAFMSGDIYLTRISKKGVMSDTRKVFTDDVLRASTEWFIHNKKRFISYEDGHNVFYTNDKEKAERIKAILLEEER